MKCVYTRMAKCKERQVNLRDVLQLSHLDISQIVECKLYYYKRNIRIVNFS